MQTSPAADGTGSPGAPVRGGRPVGGGARGGEEAGQELFDPGAPPQPLRPEREAGLGSLLLRAAHSVAILSDIIWEMSSFLWPHERPGLGAAPPGSASPSSATASGRSRASA